MAYDKIARLLENGQIDRALQVCYDEAPPKNPDPQMAEMSKMMGFDIHEQFRQGTALELLWIAYAYAKQERWEKASKISKESFSIWRDYNPSEDITHLLAYLQLAADVTLARQNGYDYMKLRQLILDELLPDVERNMREKAAE